MHTFYFPLKKPLAQQTRRANKRASFALLSLLIVLFTSGTIYAGDRHKIDATQAPWHKIGKLIVRGKGSCTASLVGPNTILTAAHCIYDFNQHAFISPSQLTFLSGYEGIKLMAQSSVSSYTLAMRDMPDMPMDEEDLLNDWALITLKYPVGCMLGHFELWDGQSTLKNQLISAGYQLSNSKHLSLDRACKLYGKNQRGSVWRLKNCSSEHGDSGAPVFSVIDNKLNLIGIISASANDEAGIARTFIVPNAQFEKHIQKQRTSCEKLTP